jgi:AraC-like DNA-binding protein
MDLTIKTSTNQTFDFHPGMPAGVSFSLPGKNAWSSNNKYGLICFEEFKTGGFTIRSSYFKFTRKMTLYCRMHNPLLALVGVRIAMFNKWSVGLRGQKTVLLPKDQFVIYYSGKREEKLVFEKDKEYRSFETLCPPSKLEAVLKLFPTVSALMDDITIGNMPYMHPKPMLVPHSAMEILQNKEELFSDDILASFFTFLLEAVEGKLEEESPLAHEKAAIVLAQRLIVADISVHYTIQQLAKKVNLNESRLKFVFKHEYKSSIYQYLLKVRMEKGKELLEAGNHQMKDIATLTGYRYLTSFITTFHKYHGYTPRSVRRMPSTSHQ